ncbi:hypothetical protein [uncultured Pseudodesulfovibrio sp.]|uniref:hypothetical protein n=1 Tax=uncultured Pseudodesulfovibrio sp. TaxID=2035858 RepID=UPI0029C93BFF|nr:hypothetical protein [uncultured Pseudodesulfovibrio sp.]
MTRLVAGIATLNLPSLFAAARKRILLHAAVYGPFADSAPHREALTTALAKPDFERLDIIDLTDAQPWSAPFMHALRLDATKEEHAKTLHASHEFLHELKKAYPEKTHVYPQHTIPCMPIIIIDDTIIFGQYAHCEDYAANGFWGIIKADVETLFDWAKTNRPGNASDQEVAAYRLICECHHAMTGELNEHS